MIKTNKNGQKFYFINKIINIVAIILWTGISGIFCYWRSYKSTFIWGDWCGYQSFFNVVLTILVFAFILNMNFEKMPNRLELIIRKVSGLSLGGYLVSWVFDQAFYPILIEKVPSVTSRLEMYFIIVPLVFVLSLLTSYILSIIQGLLEKTFS